MGWSGADVVAVAVNMEVEGVTLLACKRLCFFMASFTLVWMCSFALVGVVVLSWVFLMDNTLVIATCVHGRMWFMPEMRYQVKCCSVPVIVTGVHTEGCCRCLLSLHLGLRLVWQQMRKSL